MNDTKLFVPSDQDYYDDISGYGYEKTDYYGTELHVVMTQVDEDHPGVFSTTLQDHLDLLNVTLIYDYGLIYKRCLIPLPNGKKRAVYELQRLSEHPKNKRPTIIFHT